MRLQRFAVSDAKAFGQYFGKNEYRESQQTRENADHHFIEQGSGEATDEHRTERIGDGVERQDRRDRGVELVFDNFQAQPATRPALFKTLDFRDRGAEHNGL